MRKLLILLVLLSTGCATSSTDNIQSVLDKYKTVVFDNGVDLEESKVIAQQQLIKKNVADLYDLSHPQVDDDIAELPNHQDYWFIFFKEKQSTSIPFIFMVLVDRKSGKIKFADDYNEGNRWILEAALLR